MFTDRNLTPSRAGRGTGYGEGNIRAFQPLEISLMRGTVDFIKHQNRDRDCAENRDCRNEEYAEVTKDCRVHLARCRMLRKADPCEHESGKEGADSRDAFRYETVGGKQEAFRSLSGRDGRIF